MTLERKSIPARVSSLLDDRPVRWGEALGDYDGRERTLEIFHTRAESRRLYADVLDAWSRRALAGPVAPWTEERSEVEPPVEVADIEPLGPLPV